MKSLPLITLHLIPGVDIKDIDIIQYKCKAKIYLKFLISGIPKLEDKKMRTLRIQISDIKSSLLMKYPWFLTSVFSRYIGGYLTYLDILRILSCLYPISVIPVGDLYQLLQVLQKPVYGRILWRNVQMCELTEVTRIEVTRYY